MSVEQEASLFSGHCVKITNSDLLLLLFIFSQAVALWLRNTNYSEEHKECFDLMQMEADAYDVKLFQRKSVFEMLWGYTDPFLKALIIASEQPPPFPQCPGPDGGLIDFVQMQVRYIPVVQ